MNLYPKLTILTLSLTCFCTLVEKNCFAIKTPKRTLSLTDLSSFPQAEDSTIPRSTTFHELKSVSSSPDVNQTNVKQLAEALPLTFKKKIFILSLDGGGIRGIIHAHVLSRFENLFRRKTAKIFSLAAGTSTGSIVAAGIGVPNPKKPTKPLYSAQDILKLYLDERYNMFEKHGIRKQISTGNGAFGPRYSVAKMEETLRRHFGQRRLSDMLIPTAIPALEVLSGKGPKVFSSISARNKPERDYTIWEVLRASTAAPSYFESKQLLEDASGENQDKVLNFWDGGLFAHNPSEIALLEARKSFPETPIEDFILVSIGTGDKKTEIDQVETKRIGLANGGSKIFDAMMSAQNEWVHKKMKKLLKGNYVRLQVDLDADSISMDNLTSDYLESLYFATEKMLEENNETILRLKNLWDIQKGRKKSMYDLHSEAHLLIAEKYAIPLENRKIIHNIYQNYCAEHDLNCGNPKGVRKAIHHMRSTPIVVQHAK